MSKNVKNLFKFDGAITNKHQQSTHTTISTTMPKSYTIRDATDKELERIKEFQDNCPDFGFHNLSDDYDGWGADTLAERRKVLFDYIDEFSDTKFYEDIAYTRGWADHTGLSITTITRRAQPLVEYVLADDGWLGKGETSDCWQGLDAGKDFKFLYVGLIRLLCSVRGIQDEAAHISGWFMDYDPKQTGFFGINGCDGDNKCHTVPNPVGPKQPDGYRVAPTKKVVEIKQVEITQDSIIHHMKTNMSNEDSIELIRKLMSEFDIKEQKSVEVFTCPEGFDEAPLPDGRIIWENENTGDIVFPCEDVSKAKLFVYSNKEYTDIKPKEL